MNLKRITVITGHYGSGKTNISVNLAINLSRTGKNCTIVDLDIVNPYFRTADFKELFSENNITLTASKYAGSNLDIPSLGFDLRAVTKEDNRFVIIDVGGDDAGAAALGRYNEILQSFHKKNQLDMFYVVNCYRYLTKKPEEALELMREIETVSGLKCTGIINNSNLGTETSADVILNSLEYAAKTAEITSLQITATTGKAEFSEKLKNVPNFFPAEIYVKSLF